MGIPLSPSLITERRDLQVKNIIVDLFLGYLECSIVELVNYRNFQMVTPSSFEIAVCNKKLQLPYHG